MQSLPHRTRRHRLEASLTSTTGTSSRSPASCRLRDTCNVYVLAHGRERRARRLRQRRASSTSSTSSGSSASRTSSSRTTTATRSQGLARAAAAGDPDLGAAGRARADRRASTRHWQARRSTTTTTCGRTASRCSSRCPSPAPSPSTARARYGGLEVFTLPTPGHTAGSVTYLVERRRPAARLQRRPRSTATGKVWSLAATQWSYSGVEGLAATHVSCGVLADREPGPAAARRTASRSTIRRPRSRSCATRVAGARRPAARAAAGTSSAWLREPVGAGHAAPAAQPHLLRAQLRAALRVRRGAPDRLRLRR